MLRCMSQEVARNRLHGETLVRQLCGVKQPPVPRDGAAEIDPTQTSVVGYSDCGGTFKWLRGRATSSASSSLFSFSIFASTASSASVSAIRNNGGNCKLVGAA